MPDVKLKVNGFDYAGWKQARVTRSIESVAGSFDLTVSDRWAHREQSWPILEEDECEVLIGDTKIIVGHVDKRSLSYDATSHALRVSGRDRTGVLVDCSAQLDKWEFRNIDVLKFVKRVCDPFGIDVALAVDVFPPIVPSKVTIDPGDSAFEAIEKVCRIAGLLPVSDGVGGLLLTRSGVEFATSALVEGENVLSASADYDASGRFRTYLVLGQHKGTDDQNGKNAATIKGFAEDENVKRVARTLVVRPEGNVTPAQANKRAQWEATVRAARADSVSVVVQGWTQGDGSVWPINANVQITCPKIGVRGSMLITQATYNVGDEGTTTELTLRGPDSFLPEPVVTKKKGSGLWKEIAKGAF